MGDPVGLTDRDPWYPDCSSEVSEPCVPNLWVKELR